MEGEEEEAEEEEGEGWKWLEEWNGRSEREEGGGEGAAKWKRIMRCARRQAINNPASSK